MRNEKPKRDRNILDTNTLISATILLNSIPRKALNRASEMGDIYFSLETISEILDVIKRPKFNKYLPLLHRLEFVEDFINFAEKVEAPPLETPVCRDPKDDKFLALALAIDAQYIITGDDDLLVLNPFQKTVILKAKDYLEIANVES